MSLKPYPAYKDSGVAWLGEVPEHWDLRRLGFYFDERREKVSDKDFQALSVTKNGIVPQLDTAAKTDDGDNRKKVCIGDFVINSRSDRKGSSGISYLDGSVSLINTVLAPRPEIVSAYANQLLRSQTFQEEFYRFGKGIVADLWSTNYSEMKNILIPVPSEDEQHAIAALLDSETAKIDDLIAQQENLISLLAEKRQATISHAVTKGLNPAAPMKDSGVEWLGQIPAHWEMIQTRRLVRSIGQGWSPNAGNAPCEPGQWGVLKISAVKFGQFVESENKVLLEDTTPEPSMEVRANDVLITRANTPDLVGDACVVPSHLQHRLMLSDLIYRLIVEPDQLADYIVYFLTSDFGRYQIKRDARGTSMTMAKISQGHILSWLITVPNKIEQELIVSYLREEIDKIRALTTEAVRVIELLRERRMALISAAVTGKIDVRGEGPEQVAA